MGGGPFIEIYLWRVPSGGGTKTFTLGYRENEHKGD